MAHRNSERMTAMQIQWHDLIGNLGVALVVAAYLLLQLRRLGADALAYSVLNALGAGLILLSLTHDFNFPAFVMEAAWLIISFWGIALWVYLIGAVHGLAGSAAVMLLLLPQISSVWAGIGYLVVFGIGTMISMAMITVVLGVPFAVGGRFRGLDRIVARVAGTASLLFGFGLMADLALGTALMPF